MALTHFFIQHLLTRVGVNILLTYPLCQHVSWAHGPNCIPVEEKQILIRYQLIIPNVACGGNSLPA